MQVVPDDQLLQTALDMAKGIAKQSSTVVKLIKDMQHKGQQYDVNTALQYERRIASDAYQQMAQQRSATKAQLTDSFTARSKL